MKGRGEFSLADYALKKLNSLVSFNPKMDEFTKIALIVIGLPFAVQEKIDRAEIETVSKLLSKLNSFERQPRFSVDAKDTRFRKKSIPNRSSTARVSTPCSYCIGKGFSGRSHEEADCYTKKADKTRSANALNPTYASKSKNSPSNLEGNLVSLAEVKAILTEIDSASKNG